MCSAAKVRLSLAVLAPPPRQNRFRKSPRAFEAVVSFEARNEASHARCTSRRRMSVESGLDGLFKFVCGRRMTGPAEILVQIIDAAVVRETAAGVENGYFWCYTGLSQFHKRTLGVTQGRKLGTIFTLMLA